MAQLGSRGGTTWSMAEVQGMFKIPSSSRLVFVRYLQLFSLPSGHRSPDIIRNARRHCLEPQNQKHHQRGAGTINSNSKDRIVT
jgi:hypothetical protein